MDRGFGEKGGIYSGCGARAYIGHLGAVPPVVSSDNYPGGVSARAKPPEADEFSANEIKFPHTIFIEYGKILKPFVSKLL